MNLTSLPENLPMPIDDGTSDHLFGLKIPSITLISTDGNEINLAKLKGRNVIFVYPMTGRPDVALPQGWNDIPGARGCTPQSCSYRDMYQEFKLLNVEVFGLSTQSTEYQQEVKSRLHLPFQLLSDSNYILKKVIELPTFTVETIVLYKRITLVIEDAEIKKVFYPVFPPDKNAEQVLAYFKDENS